MDELEPSAKLYKDSHADTIIDYVSGCACHLQARGAFPPTSRSVRVNSSDHFQSTGESVIFTGHIPGVTAACRDNKGQIYVHIIKTI